jgi:hypothetical protein
VVIVGVPVRGAAIGAASSAVDLPSLGSPRPCSRRTSAMLSACLLLIDVTHLGGECENDFLHPIEP